MFKLEKLNTPLCQLGEGLLWDYERGLIWWLDIDQSIIYSYNIKENFVHEIKVNRFVGALMLTNTNHLLAFADNSLFLFNPEKNEFKNLDDKLQIDAIDTLSNDAKIDRQGNVVFGTKHTTCNLAKASFYHYDIIKKTCKVLGSNITVFNGPAFSPKGDKIYFADSPTGKIISADYKNGNITDKKVFAQTNSEVFPDGMTIDSEGYLWNAEWNGFCVKRYNPNGDIDMKIDLPVPLVTNLCFGGENLDTLYITTAFKTLSKEQREKYPQSGSLFYIKLKQILGLKEKKLNLK